MNYSKGIINIHKLESDIIGEYDVYSFHYGVLVFKGKNKSENDGGRSCSSDTEKGEDVIQRDNSCT